jgi:hypothetical protein
MPAGNLAVQYKNDAPLAQLDRASGFEPEGWGFKSLGVRHVLLPKSDSCLFLPPLSDAAMYVENSGGTIVTDFVFQKIS